ncbi:hypothetical protein [Catenisphaera adipataccumulans]|jgi:hypothetical protein|uniref:Uncharacterized protein n=1 Tax=Catenisphaera adipataccumulans TaxID=700500 RepID=A0A7W8CYY1_9FIRM|nr:hypothetical protein [Catenisphaera adipataccumulans]MBB5183584.1 hypothetical protein [Catenisphaera adipataccumulans]
MKINTDEWRRLAHKVSILAGPAPPLPTAAMQDRQAVIEAKLQSVADYLYGTAVSYEELDHSVNQSSKWETSTSHYLNLRSIVHRTSGTSYISGKAHWAYGECRKPFHWHGVDGGINADVGAVDLKGKAEASLFKNKKLYPHLELTGKASASVLSGTVYANAGNQWLRGHAHATGQVGTVYANAEAVLSPDEQTFDLGVGAAALRGEVETSLSIFGAKVSLTGSGSVGSAEAQISYHHKNREWEFGSHLGFIAGLGFKVNVQY